MKKILIGILAFLISDIAISQTLPHPINLDFERGEPGRMPLGWEVPGYAVKLGVTAWLSDENPKEGKYCLQMQTKREFKDTDYGSIMQSVDARQYRGKTVRFRAAVKAEISSPAGSAQLWLRERLANEEPGTLISMDEDPILFPSWDYYEIEMRVSRFAEQLNFGLLVYGNGRAWIDDASIEIIDMDTSAYEPPKKLTGAELENLKAFTELYGYAMFFHPTEEVQALDKVRFLLTGIDAIEKAKNADELIDIMNRLYLPVVPSVNIYRSDANINIPRFEEPPDSALPNIALAWLHQLVSPKEDKSSIGTRIVNIYNPIYPQNGTLFHILPANNLRGKKIRFSADVKAEPKGTYSSAQLWIRGDSQSDEIVLKKFMQDEPIKSGKWKKYSIEAKVPENTEFLRLGLVLVGDGKAWFDDAELEFRDDGGNWEEAEIGNPGFEEEPRKNAVSKWLFPDIVKDAGYMVSTAKDTKTGGKYSVMIESDPAKFIGLPEPGEMIRKDLPGGISFALSMTTFVDSMRTIPYPPENIERIEYPKNDGFIPSGDDRTTRIALVIHLWNLLRHFSLYEIPEKIWYNALDSALVRASEDNNKVEFLHTLEKMTSVLDDGQLRLWLSDYNPEHSFPFLWRYIDGKVIITYSENEKEFPAGSEVLTIDEKDIKALIAEETRYLAGPLNNWKRHRALSRIRIGNEGEENRIQIKTPGNETRMIKTAKSFLVYDLKEKKPEPVTRLDSHYLYIDMAMMNDQTLKQLVPEMKNTKGIIFDARGEGPLSEHFLGLFIDEEIEGITWKIPIFTKPDHELINFKTYHGKIIPAYENISVPIVFLADERTYGYTESMMAIVSSAGIGEIIGEKTAGAAGDIMPLGLFGGYNMTITGFRGLKPGGEKLMGNPVEPDVDFNAIPELFENRRDPYLYKALEILKNK